MFDIIKVYSTSDNQKHNLLKILGYSIRKEKNASETIGREMERKYWYISMEELMSVQVDAEDKVQCSPSVQMTMG